MKFRSLKIEKEAYGPNKGKLIAELRIEGAKATTTMILPDDVGEAILQLSKESIIDAVEKSANDFIFELTTLIPETLKIEK